MARPKLHDEARVQTNIRLPESIVDRLRAQAGKRDLSVNWLVTKAIELFLERLEESDGQVDNG